MVPNTFYYKNIKYILFISVILLYFFWRKQPYITIYVTQFHNNSKHLINKFINSSEQNFTEVHNNSEHNFPEIHNNSEQNVTEIHNNSEQNVTEIYNNSEQNVTEIHNNSQKSTTKFNNSSEQNNIQNFYSTYETKSGLKCRISGRPAEGSKVYWPYYYYPEYPSLQDIYEDNEVLTVILSGHLVKTHCHQIPRIQHYASMKWALYFHKSNNTEDRNTVLNADAPIITTIKNHDPTLHAFVLRFNIPVEYQNKYNYVTIQTVLNESNPKYRPLNTHEPLYNASYFEEITEVEYGITFTKIFMHHPNNVNEDDLSYRNVPFCQILDKYSIYVNPLPKSNTTQLDPIYYSPNGQKKVFLRFCTKAIIFDEIQKSEQLHRWIFYHLDQGFSPPALYYNRINGSYEGALGILEKAAKQNLIELVDFVFPYANAEHETPLQETSCIFRNKGRTIWLGLNDLDERFFAPERTDEYANLSQLTIAEILKKEYTNADFFSKYGGILCPNNWMIKKENESSYHDSQYNYGARQKLLLIPDNVDFIRTHIISSGKEQFPAPNELIVNGHFKYFTPQTMTFTELIYSEKMTKINQELAEKIHKFLYE